MIVLETKIEGWEICSVGLGRRRVSNSDGDVEIRGTNMFAGIRMHQIGGRYLR